MSKYINLDTLNLPTDQFDSVLAIQTPTAEICKASYGRSCEGCRQPETGGDSESLYQALLTGVGSAKEVLAYCTSKGEPDLKLAQEFMRRLRESGIDPKMRVLTHKLYGKKDLAGVGSVELSYSPWQNISESSAIAREAGVPIIASLREQNRNVLGTKINLDTTPEAMNALAQKMYELMGTDPIAMYVRANQSEVSRPTKSMIYANETIALDTPELVLPIKAYNEFRQNQGLEPTAILDPFGNSVEIYK
jgi:hypothetical protein